MFARGSAWLFCSLVAMPALAQAAEANLYPEIRIIILEAEHASNSIHALPNSPDPMAWISDLYARAGYLEDATRVSIKAGLPLERLAPARTLYGDLDGALKSVTAMRDPVRRTALMIRLAGILWRMGDRASASKVLDEAEGDAITIPELAHRKLQLQMIAQQRDALSNNPPSLLSAAPQPKVRKAASPTVPAFPITVEGFRNQGLEAVAHAAKENEAYLTSLYALIIARDREGLLKHTAEATSPFQRAIGLASIEHLQVQAGDISGAEESAQAIADDSLDCSLAKAEALTAAGTAWARKGDVSHARQSFENALQKAVSVVHELAFGKAVVVASIAAAQAESGMRASSSRTFDSALEFAAQVQPRPKPANGGYPQAHLGSHFQDDAYRAVFHSAIRIGDLGAARHTDELWRASAEGYADTSIVYEWLDVSREDEALSYARGLKNPTDRISALIFLSSRLLDEAGAPLL